MSVRSRIVVAVLWLASLFAVHALAQPSSRPEQVLSGSDIGFRVDRTDAHGTPLGSLVVRIDGKRVEVGFAARVVTR